MKESSEKVVWIDMDNSPHIHFFNPIIKELEKHGVRVIITARDYAQVFELLKLFNLKFIAVGKHPGKLKILKVWGTMLRAIKLAKVVKRYNPSLAFSHGVRAQIIAAKILNIKSANAWDYEFAKDIPFTNPNIAFIPEVITGGKLSHMKHTKLIKFPGIKEDIYVPSFEPDTATREKIGKIDFEKIIITLRPPATVAHYYTHHTEEMYNELMNYILRRNDIVLIITPRTNDQRKELLKKWGSEIRKENVIILDKVINGLDLIWESDLVISGGGTMIREAAALGVPAYSIFGGTLGAVDLFLEKQNRLTILRQREEIYSKIKILKRKREQKLVSRENKTLEFIITSTLNILKEVN